MNESNGMIPNFLKSIPNPGTFKQGDRVIVLTLRSAYFGRKGEYVGNDSATGLMLVRFDGDRFPSLMSADDLGPEAVPAPDLPPDEAVQVAAPPRPPAEHEIKCWPLSFRKMARGDKRATVRVLDLEQARGNVEEMIRIGTMMMVGACPHCVGRFIRSIRADNPDSVLLMGKAERSELMRLAGLAACLLSVNAADFLIQAEAAGQDIERGRTAYPTGSKGCR